MAQSLLENISEQVFTEKTIRRMYELISRAKTDQEFQKLIYGVVNGAMRGNWKNYRQELSTILNWARKAADYRRDPYGVELLQDVWATLDRQRGDCDDFTVLLCSAAEVLGSPCRIVTVSTRKDREPSHVYGEALVGGKWLGMDATIPGAALGWQPAHVTDKKIWTRKELGLGGDDLEGIEGLGMFGNGYDVPGFKSSLYPVSQRLAPGVPDNISDTFADGIPGTGSPSRRKIWQAPIANVSDRTSNPRPGGGVYQPALPIKSFPTPQELWTSMDRKFIPKILNPDSAWWGTIPTSREDLNRMFPGSEGTMDTYLKDIASVPASAIAEISDDVSTQLQLGEIGEDELGQAIGEAVEDYALGKLPRTKRFGADRKAPRKWRGGEAPGRRLGTKRPPGVPVLPEKQYLIPGPRQLVARGGTLNGLGDIFSDMAKQISTAVVNGTIPGDTTSINQVINQAVDAALPAGAPKPASTLPSVATVAKTAIPMGMLGLLAAVAFLMSRKGGGRKYRSNPSRRRSRGRSRGRRGGGDNTMLMLAAGGAAAYYFLLRPGAALQPKVPTSTVPQAPKPASATQQYTAAAIQAAPSIINAITSLFSSPSSSGTPVPGAVTDLSIAQGTALPNAVVSL